MKRKPISKRSVFISIVIGLLGLVILWSAMTDVDSVTISQQYAQSKIEEKLPITKSGKYAMVNFVVDRLHVDFQADNLLGIVAHATVKTRFGNASVQVITVGTPVFKDMAFYFMPQTFDFEDFSLSPKAEASAKKAGRLASNATKILQKKLQKSGLLEGTDIDVSQTATAMTEKIKEHAKPALQKIITRHLMKHPIKRLDGVKGTIVNLAIDKIQVDNGTLTIDFSLLTLTLNILLLAALFIVAILVALFLGPMWFDFF